MIIALLVTGVRPARADEVLFNNGDRLSGTVLSVEGGKMKLKTAVAGEITVDLKDVKGQETAKRAIDLGPDLVAVRGAVCRGGRSGPLDPRCVASLAELLVRR